MLSVGIALIVPLFVRNDVVQGTAVGNSLALYGT